MNIATLSDLERDRDIEQLSESLYDEHMLSIQDKLENYDNAISYLTEVVNYLSLAKDALNGLDKYSLANTCQKGAEDITNEIAELLKNKNELEEEYE